MDEKERESSPAAAAAAAGGGGGGSGSVSSSGGGSSRKEKKKQAKEERDRLKQAEKKKRRLEKALANAAAIRSELEKKKQRRKEEEQRLDAEGAALAEAVALHVLVDEDSDCDDHVGAFDAETNPEEDMGSSVNGETLIELNSLGLSLGVRKREITPQKLEKVGGLCKFSMINDQSKRSCQARSELVVSAEREVQISEMQLNGQENFSKHWKSSSSWEEKARASKERAKAAEVAAGLAAAQAVAALRIAEEARAEAELAKKAAEAAMIEALDGKDVQKSPELLLESKMQPESIEKERDELKAKLKATERQLKEKTRQVSELEQNLEEVTQYLLEFKTMFEDSKNEDHAACSSVKVKGGSSGHNAAHGESSSGTVEQRP